MPVSEVNVRGWRQHIRVAEETVWGDGGSGGTALALGEAAVAGGLDVETLQPDHNVRGDEKRWTASRTRRVRLRMRLLPYHTYAATVLGMAVSREVTTRDLKSYGVRLYSPFTPRLWRGCKVESLRIVGRDADGLCYFDLVLVGKDEASGPTYEEPTYPNTCPYLYVYATVSVHNIPVAQLREFELNVRTDLTWGRPVSPDRYPASLVANQTVVTGIASADIYENALAALARADNYGTVVIVLSDGTNTLTITMPRCLVTGASQEGQIEGLVQYNLTWEASMSVIGETQLTWTAS